MPDQKVKTNPIEQLNELIWSDVLERQGRVGRILATLLRTEKLERLARAKAQPAMSS